MFRPRTWAAAGVAIAALAAVVPTALPAAAAGVVPPTRAFAPKIEALASYDPQKTCAPVARPGVTAFEHLVLATYRDTGNDGITASCTPGKPGGSDGSVSEHYEGRAWDWAVNPGNHQQTAEVGALLSWLLGKDRFGNGYAMARRLGIMYVIYNKRIWGAYRAAEGWRPYSCSGVTGCHQDHVHFSFSWAGALKHTSFWGAPVVGAPKPPVPAPLPPTTPAPAPAPTPAPAPSAPSAPSQPVDPSAGDLVTNGGFEDPQIDRDWQILGSVPGWSARNGCGIELQRGPSADGAQHAELDANCSGGVYQDLRTVPGASYVVSFAFSPRPRTGEGENVLRLRWDGHTVDTVRRDGWRGDTDWRTYSYAVTATSATTRLELDDAGRSDRYGTLVDHVSVVPGSTATGTSGDPVRPDPGDGESGGWDGNGCDWGAVDWSQVDWRHVDWAALSKQLGCDLSQVRHHGHEVGA